MSYILDALKRAEAERDRGAVPTLNTLSPAGSGAARSSGPLLYVLIGVGLLLVVLLGLLAWRSFGAPAAPPPQAQPAQMPPPVAAQMEAQRRPAPPPVVHKAAPSPAPAIAAKPVVAPATQPAQAAATAPSPVLTMAELPDAVRRSLPPLKFGGAMYSDAPASRVLILNGQLLHEGESVQQGLVIEAIGVHKATLNQNGQRFSIDY